MPQISVRITNLDAIRRAFSKAPVAMTRELNKAIRRSLIVIERDSKIGTPVDTGRLRASHRSVFTQLKGVLSTNTNYDVYVHDGTRYIKGRPYMLNAVQSNESKVDREFHTAVQNVLDEIGRAT